MLTKISFASECSARGNGSFRDFERQIEHSEMKPNEGKNEYQEREKKYVENRRAQVLHTLYY